MSAERVHHILHEYLNTKRLSFQRCAWQDAGLIRTSIASFCNYRQHLVPSQNITEHRATYHLGDRAPKKSKGGLSVNKVIATVFRDIGNLEAMKRS